MVALCIILIITLFCLAIVAQDHEYHNAVRRGFGLKEESFYERLKRKYSEEENT